MTINKMKIFVTGGAGFIGSCLVKKLLEHNIVTVFDNFSLGNKKFLDVKNKNLKIIKGDVIDFKKLKKVMKNHHFVYHLAANSDIPAGLKNTKLDFEINTIGTMNILESMIKNKIKNLVFASSSAVFGYPTKFPTPEDYGPCLPESLYGASKLAAEGYISAYSNLFNIKSWVFRFANITGAPATHGIIFDFMEKTKNNSTLNVLGNGSQEKSYLTNEMLVEAILYIVKKTSKNKKNIMYYNLGNDDTISVKNITKIFSKVTERVNKIKYSGGKEGWKGDVSKMKLDIRKIKNEGWKPRKKSKDCILEAIKKIMNQYDNN